ncbi:hypothetical protein [Kitasatospora purpeofusca]|uniref:hypothetical protein n=1 Tax=Kitasatospora purpeofusca TaxID=67352 RepID=UPI003801192F
MTEPHDEQPSIRYHRTCEDCQGGPGDDVRTLSVGRDLSVTETWHTDRCPAFTIERILIEASAEKLKEQEAWAKDAFPSVHRRLTAAAAAIPAGDTAAPFAAALMELVQAQAEDTGRFVILPTWTEILERHFPPQEPA